MPFDLGDTVRLTAECKDPAGTLTDATTATLDITLPDGTSDSPTVAAPTATGVYVHDYVSAQAGRHAVRWVFTGPASAYTDVFDVRPAIPALILSVADAKAQLNITSTRNDEELRSWLESITRGVQEFTGVSVRQSFTETHRLSRLGQRTFVLRRTPVLELTALTAIDGTAVDVSELDADPDTGIVQYVGGGTFKGTVRATYTAGRDVIPSNITRAAAIILQHLWRTQTGRSAGPVLGGGSDFSVTEQVPGFGYAIPNRALQLMEPDRLPPGVA